ncbi:putative phosphoinositide phosphatase SAC2-like [Capsicum annuum]|nr:putative phosphoinositide phosphatase SAC2-like [Capsicum annuum]
MPASSPTSGFLVKMTTIVDVVSHLLNFPEAIERLGIRLRSNESSENKGNIPVDILDTPKEYIFHMDVPGLSKSDIQKETRSINCSKCINCGRRMRKELDLLMKHVYKNSSSNDEHPSQEDNQAYENESDSDPDG